MKRIGRCVRVFCLSMLACACVLKCVGVYVYMLVCARVCVCVGVFPRFGVFARVGVCACCWCVYVLLVCARVC